MSEGVRFEGPVLGTHVDGIFGGFKSNGSFERAAYFREWMCAAGKSFTISFKMKPNKTSNPAKKQIIQGRQFNCSTRGIRMDENGFEEQLHPAGVGRGS